MEYRLLTKKDIAERWQVKLRTIDTYINEGIITPVKKIKHPRFTLEEIEAAEGVERSRFSPVERRKMQQRIDELEKIVENYEKGFLGIERIVLDKKLSNY